MNNKPSAELLENPIQTLGTPLPPQAGVHAVSVCFPNWGHVLGYETGDKEIAGKLQTGYPRFRVPDPNQELHTKLGDSPEKKALVFPSKKLLLRMVRKDLEDLHNEVTFGKLEQLPGGTIVTAQAEEVQQRIQKWWQHVGGLSSRAAAQLNEGKRIEFTEQEPHQQIKEKIAKLYLTTPEDVFLSAAGMTSFNTARAAIQKFKPGKTIQFGFPYVDSQESQKKFGEIEFLGHGNDEIEKLEAIIKKDHENISGIFLEFPTNPLLKSADLKQLSAIARAHDIPVIIDDTLAPPTNVDLCEYADLYVTSLTKYASGEGNVMAGSVALNPKSPYAQELKEVLEETHEETLFVEDAEILNENMQDWEGRMEIINQTTKEVVEFLRTHSKIKTVHYSDDEIYQQHAKGTEHGGGLFSLEFHNPEDAISFYNNINICKGPSLGTNFTIACPYTLLAHFNELNEVADFEIPEHLVRISIGLEEKNDLIERIQKALI